MKDVERRSLAEWAVLGLLAEAQAHPFALARVLSGGEPLGRVLTVRRPLVYRAVDRLARDGLIERHRTEPGRSGPERTVYGITGTGKSSLDSWLCNPVIHIRDLRLSFLLKLALLRRSGRQVEELVRAQQAALFDTFVSHASLPDQPDETELWRHHNAAAAAAFLEDLASRA